MQVQQPQKQQPYSSYSINETHNLVVQNIVQNHQVKFIMFHRIQHIKILYKNSQQHRFLNGLVVAGRNFIKLYAVFSNLVYEQLAYCKIHQDIKAIYSWQKCIVIQTKHKIVGLVYEDNIFKNAFMLSLQFLPLTAKDSCKCSFDKHGLMFSVIIKNYLLLCFSDSMIIRYKGKPIYKQFTQIISQDIKWNRAEKTYIEEVIKIKINDFQLSHISNINICNEALYFVGLKNLQKPNEKLEFNQKAFYQLQAPLFFVQNKNPIIQFLAKKDAQVLQMIPYVYNKQTQCLFCKYDSIYAQIGRQMVLIDQFGTSKYEIIHKNFSEYFSLWVKIGNQIYGYYRNGNTFVNKTININFYYSSFILKQQLNYNQGTIIYANQTQLSMIKIDLSFVKKMISNKNQTNKNQINNQIQEQISLNSKSSVQIQRSFGNIVDFQFYKNSIFIIQSKSSVDQSFINNQVLDSSGIQYQIKSKLYQLRRSLVTDPKPYITHQKKNYIEELNSTNKFKSIKTIKFRFKPINNAQNSQLANSYTDNIIVTQNYISPNKFSFYRQLSNQANKQKGFGFQKLLDQIFFYSKIYHQDKDYLILINKNAQIWIQKDSQEEQTQVNKDYQVKKQLPQFNLQTKFINELFVIDNYLIYKIQKQNKHVFKFYDIFKNTHTNIQLPIQNEPLRLFMNKKRLSFRKKDKTSTVLQIIVVYKNSIQIFQFYPQNKDLRLVYKSQNISQGVPYLSNYNNHHIQDKSIFEKDKFRSITCPQYIVSEYHNNQKQPFIKNAGIYFYKNIFYLIFVNSQGELIVYKKCLSFISQAGFIYKRILLPLNIIKTFKYIQQEYAIEQIGQGILKISNIILCKGQFLQHNINHASYFQMDSCLWTIQKQKIKMVDLKPLAGSNQPLFRSSSRKDSKDFTFGGDFTKIYQNSLQQNIQIMSNFILTPIRTMMSKQLMGFEISGDYFMIYSKSGFQVLNSKDMKPIWACNLSAQNPQRKQVIISTKLFEHYIAVSYYDYINDQNNQFKSIKFKFRIYNILSKKKILQKPKSTDQPILHIRPISSQKILIATSSTLYIYQIKGQKTLQPIRIRNFSKRFGLSTFSYIPQVFDQKNRSHKPCYMLLANQFGGLSFFVGKWIQTQILRQMWFQRIRCHIRNVQLFHYGEQLKALITDQDCNLIVINLKPDTPEEAAKAQKLADLNVGSRANVLRIRHQQDRKIYACFQDGTIKSISAVKLDNPQISLIDFQEQDFCKQIPLMGGFNQRVSRLLNQKYRTYKYVSRGNMVDCQILQQFFSMTVNLKQQILDKSQLKMDQIKAIIRSI